MTKLLLDQGLAPGVARILRMESWDVWHVSELSMAQADDTQILERARNEHRVCVTLDHDFHMHLAVAEEGSPSVVLLRVQHLKAEGQADLIRLVCRRCAGELSEGAVVSASPKNIRIRRLPLR